MAPLLPLHLLYLCDPAALSEGGALRLQIKVSILSGLRRRGAGLQALAQLRWYFKADFPLILCMGSVWRCQTRGAVFSSSTPISRLKSLAPLRADAPPSMPSALQPLGAQTHLRLKQNDPPGCESSLETFCDSTRPRKKRRNFLLSENRSLSTSKRRVSAGPSPPGPDLSSFRSSFRSVQLPSTCVFTEEPSITALRPDAFSEPPTWKLAAAIECESAVLWAAGSSASAVKSKSLLFVSERKKKRLSSTCLIHSEQRRFQHLLGSEIWLLLIFDWAV